jgi:DNA ligase 1
MTFNNFAQWLERLEREPSRLAMTRDLGELFSQLSAREAYIVSYFCLGQLYPSYKKVQFGVAHKSVVKVVASVLGMHERDVTQQLKDVADLGVLFMSGERACSEGQLSIQGTQSGVVHDYSIEYVYDELERIARMSGTGSQEAKLLKLGALLSEVRPLEAKFIVRIVLGILRLGFSDMTLIDSFSWMLVGNKSLSKRIEDAYNRCADLGLVAYTLKEKGIAGINEIRVTLGVPMRLTSAERLASPDAIIKKIGPCFAEPKLDGFRLQIHVDTRGEKPVIHFFSRNLHDMSSMYPDLVRALSDLDVCTLIAEGEAISFDPNTGNFMPFQQTVKRKRTHGIDHAAGELPLKLFLFDVLYLNGEELLQKHLTTRRKILEELVGASRVNRFIINVTDQVMVTTAAELEHYFLTQIGSGLEGVVVKRPDSSYQPGKRNFNWIKLKRLEKGHLIDTVDTVILGYYYGKGKRATLGIGALLVGIYNKACDCFQTVAKIGTGLSDEGWSHIKRQCDQIALHDKPKNVSCNKDLFVDVWVKPEIVIEVTADELTQSPLHTAGQHERPSKAADCNRHAGGYALRFPRFVRYRDDKDSYETTSIDELLSFYKQ